MFSLLRPALSLLVVFVGLLGVAYPYAITGIAQAVLPGQANGSLIERNGTVVGSSLIGQPFAEDKYFWPRPSATMGADPADPAKSVSAPYNAAASSGSNLGPTAQALFDRLAGDIAHYKKGAPNNQGPVPTELATASASGLDPHISPKAAVYQAARVAAARGMPDNTVRALIDRHSEGGFLGLVGEPRVNVLMLNLALDEMSPAAPNPNDRPR